MTSYSIIFKPSVEKDLRPLPKKIVERVFERIEQMRSDPHPRQAIKLSATGGLYRIRIGDYRIVYEVDSNAKLITIHYIRHRNEVYRGL
jgi:mRNA interferase RelE/StbE